MIKSDAAIGIFAFLASLYVRLVYWTNRITIRNIEIAGEYVSNDRPIILCFWHNRLLLMPLCWPGVKGAMVLISSHRDGMLISRVITHFDMGTIEGSTSKGSFGAFRDMVRYLKKGQHVAITPDGPRGPRYYAAPGAVQLAKISGCPLVPVAFATSRARFLNSWDRFIVNMPFGRGIYVWGDPIHVDKDADDAVLEQKRIQLEQSLIAISSEADLYCGHDPVAQDQYVRDKRAA